MMDPRVVEALARAQSKLVGKSARARRAATEAVRANGSTDDQIKGFGVGPKVTGGEVVSEEAIVVHVAKKLTNAKLAKRKITSVPKKLASVATDVADVLAALASVPPGASMKHALGAELGSLACVLERGGLRWAIGASHVVAPASVFPQRGDDAWVGPSPAAKLHAWSAVAAFATVTTDVAVCKTDLPKTAAWPDGTAFAGTRDYAPANGPFTFYGFASGAKSAAGQAAQAGNIGLAVPGVGPVFYSAHALLDVASQPGDSGSAVRDAAGFLVGMVVGCTANAKACVTTWQALGPVLDVLVA